jgi:hypothetical protein
MAEITLWLALRTDLDRTRAGGGLRPALEAISPAELDGMAYDYRDNMHTAMCDVMQAANDY